MTEHERDERVDARIRDLARDYQRPPETPRAEMWERVRAERVARNLRPAQRASRGTRWAAWAIGLAATLAVGVALGRLTAHPEGRTAVALAPDTGSDRSEGASPAYQVATAEHLERVETFLSVFQAEVSAGRVARDDLELPARQLLRRTRLLRQSPVADDVALRTLLDDVELVLLQIASYAQAGDAQELQFAEQGINDRSVLLRLRSALPSAPERAIVGGAL
jgi:hypothetical protein